jgi:hypothetical protein
VARRKEKMKITNYKFQITNKFQITMTKIARFNKKRITTPIMGHDIKEQSKMVDHESKIFAGSRVHLQCGIKECPWRRYVV